MMRSFLIVAMAVLLVFATTGCGSVYLRGDAATAAETSTMDAYQAYQRATTQPESVAWQKDYLRENYCQWRWFVRSARKDMAWGPKLDGE
ncbi:MAG: hypothetical protein BIFFINMI_04275 [Phycisphaerae bacterium]|nr:hypothetical protein [Phycisphaerae bacterium]